MKRLIVMAFVSALLAFMSTATTASMDDPCDPPIHSYCPGYTVPVRVIRADSDTPTVFSNLGIRVTVPAASRGPDGVAIPTGSWIADFGTIIRDGVTNSIFGGGRDLGDFLCTACPTTGDVTSASQWGPFIYGVANPILWPNLGPSGLNAGAWRPGDTLAICNGSSGVCIILEWHAGGGTNGWWPSINPKKPHIKVDEHKYKNKPENQQGTESIVDRGPLQDIPLSVATRTIMGTIPIIQIDNAMPLCCVIIPPPEQWVQVPTPMPSGGGAGGGGGGGVPADPYTVDLE